MADWRRHVSDRPDTVFRIGSITKQFTALAIMQLQYWRRLHVGDHICSYIPGCPHKWRDITIYELLTHTSGMPDRFNDSDYDTTHPATPEQLLKRFAAKPLNFPPGTNYYYSNAGYAILGYIVSRVSGLSYAAYLERYVFAPLHLRDTGIDPDPHRGQEATGYLSGSTTAPYINMSTAYAFGDIYSTASDLYTWDRALFGGKLVPMWSLAPMFQTHVTAVGFDGSTLHYGFGWFIDEDQHHRIISHPGLINGFSAVNEYLPDDKVTLVVLSNTQDASVAAICHDVREMVLHG